MKKISALLICSSLLCSSLLAEEVNEQYINNKKNVEQPICNLSTVKTAVAKLILKIDELEKKDKLLQEEIKDLKVIVNNKSSEEIVINENKEELIYEEKVFKVNSDKILVYKNPLYKDFSENKNSVKIGDELISDKQNKYGWVHIKDTGWVRGYLLKPIYLEKK